MGAELEQLVAELDQRYLLNHPREAAQTLEALPPSAAAGLLREQPARAVVAVFELLAPDVALALLDALPEALAGHVLAEAEPVASVAVLAQLDAAARERWLGRLDAQVARELRELGRYPENTAGSLMDPRVSPLRADASVAEAIGRLRTVRRRGLRELFVIDAEGRLAGRVEMQDLALARPEQRLEEITRGIVAVVHDLDPREEVVESLQKHAISTLPVIGHSGRFLGVIRQAELVTAMEQEASLDIQTMVGASPDERALSRAGFAVKKRLPWLQINLLTAFMAAAVVGLFEGVIAKFTALAVLLPVVAGQSGNAGAQALAVTMRGLALREISLRHWPAVLGKEAATGLANGLAVAATTAVGVYVWSGSIALVWIIALAMVISMFAAGLAGALVPILLTRFGQDPATASSIILTTVTDIVGFFSFLGIATLFASMLEQVPG